MELSRNISISASIPNNTNLIQASGGLCVFRRHLWPFHTLKPIDPFSASRLRSPCVSLRSRQSATRLGIDTKNRFLDLWHMS